MTTLSNERKNKILTVIPHIRAQHNFHTSLLVHLRKWFPCSIQMGDMEKGIQPLCIQRFINRKSHSYEDLGLVELWRRRRQFLLLQVILGHVSPGLLRAWDICFASAYSFRKRFLLFPKWSHISDGFHYLIDITHSSDTHSLNIHTHSKQTRTQNTHTHSEHTHSTHTHTHTFNTRKL